MKQRMPYKVRTGREGIFATIYKNIIRNHKVLTIPTVCLLLAILMFIINSNIIHSAYTEYNSNRSNNDNNNINNNIRKMININSINNKNNNLKIEKIQRIINTASSCEKIGKSCSIKSNLALCYLLPYGKNFGDELGPAMSKQLISNYFTGCTQNYTVYNLAKNESKRERNTKNVQCLFTLGSIMHMVRSNDHVWGTGINPYRHIVNDSKNNNKYNNDKQQNQTIKINNRIHVHATRGPRTWKLFKKYQPTTINEGDMNIIKNQILNDEDQTFGDPGFLTPTLYPQYTKKRPESSSKSSSLIHYCIVPHFQDLKLPEIQQLNSSSSLQDNMKIHIISPHDSWENVIQHIYNTCHYVISSSLHGLIVSEAIGIPTLWFQIPNQKTAKTEGNFKYNDYYDSIGYPNMKPISNININIITNSNSYKQPFPEAIRTKYTNTMIHSFPYHLFESYCH